MILIYPNKLGGDPAEIHEITEPCILLDWLAANAGVDIDTAQHQPISIDVDGFIADPRDWHRYRIKPNDKVSIFLEPGGKAIGSIVAAVVGLIGVFIFQQKVPSIGSSTSTEGEDIAIANAKANTAKVNAIIREVFGRRKVFPDYIVPPRKYFGSDPREHWMEALVSVGVGYFDPETMEVSIGDTSMAALGSQASYEQYHPGADLSSDDASIWWHTSDEVGSTTASNGLELTNTVEIEPTADAETYVLSGDLINIPDAAGSFPDDWSSGLTVRIESALRFAVSDDNVISGDFSELGPFVGMNIEIAGDNNSGFFKVASYAAPVAGSSGFPSSATGVGAPTRYDFGVIPVSFSINFDSASYTVTLNSDLADLSALLSAINSFLPSSLAAVDFGGVVRIIEVGPEFSGLALIASGTVSDVFGGTPSEVTGSATVYAQSAQITVNYMDDTPAFLATGEFDLTIGYAGLKYLITSLSSSQLMEVERLTDLTAVDSAWSGFVTRNDPLAQISLDDSSLEGGWVGPFKACPENELTDTIEWDLLFTRGLGWINKKGNIQGHAVSMELQWRDSAFAGAWTTVSKTYRNSTLDQVGYTERLSLPALMNPEVRMRRIGKQYSETVALDTMEWVGLKAKMQTRPISYPDITLLSLRIMGGKALSAASENDVSVVATRMLEVDSPVLIADFANQNYELYPSGSYGAYRPTRKMSDFIKYAATDVGYSLDDINSDELDALQLLWDSRGDTCDMIIEDDGTLKDRLNDGLAAGMAEFILERGLITPVRESAKDVEHIYSTQNMTGYLERSFTAIQRDDYDGVDVTYVDENTWEEETIECRLPGQLGERAREITLLSVTNRTRAWRIGMRQAAKDAYVRYQYKWTTELDGLNSRYRSCCGLIDDTPGYSRSALVASFSGVSGSYTIRSSEPIDWKLETVIGLRKPNGAISGPYIPTQIDEYSFSISGVDFTPMAMGGAYEPTHIFYGEAGSLYFEALVTEISPSSGSTVNCTAENYDSRVYAYDDLEPDE